MEWIDKVKKKWNDAKRGRTYKKHQLPWQMEGLDRSNKTYVDFRDAESVVFFINHVNPDKLKVLEKINYNLKTKAREILVVCFQNENELKLESNIGSFFYINEDALNETGEVNAPFINRMKSKIWDIAVVDGTKGNIGLDYLLHLCQIKCIVSKNDTNYLDIADVQMVEDEKENLYLQIEYKTR